MRFKIIFHPSEEGTVRCENATAGYWYKTLPNHGSSISTCGKQDAEDFPAAEAMKAFNNEETYQLVVVGRKEIHAKRAGTSQLFRVFNPNTKKWLGRVDPNEPLHWVNSRHECVALSKRSIEQRFPEFLFELIWM